MLICTRVQLLGALGPVGNGLRVDLRGCDLSGLHFPFHTIERAQLGGAYVGEAKSQRFSSSRMLYLFGREHLRGN